MNEDTYIKELEASLKSLAEKLRQDLQAIRGNRPSADILENIKVNCYDQWFTIQQLGSLSVVPPREVNVSVWDKNAVGAVAKAIESAKIGLSVSTDGNLVRASLSPLRNERREELIKVTKKTCEGSRIQIRHHRDETIKKIKAGKDMKTITEDQEFKLKEKAQKAIDVANDQVEKLMENKLQELGE